MAYNNWADLAAHEVEGVDYLLNVNTRNSLTSIIAVHGGGIRAGTSEVANEIASRNGHMYYSLYGIKTTGNEALFLPDNVYDEPKCLLMQGSVNYTVAVNAYSNDNVFNTNVGGLDTAKAAEIKNSLTSAGFSTGNLAVTQPSHIANKNLRGQGVVLEISSGQRKKFFINGDFSRANREARNFTPDFFNYVDAIARVTDLWDPATADTPFYHLALARPQDSMADVNQWINGNWTRIEDIPGAPIVATPNLPNSGTYKLGDRVYHTPTQSIYLLVCQDADWGWHWRPIQAGLSPWVTMTNNIMQNANWSANATASDPLQVALGNDGMCYWRGILTYVPGTGIPRGTFISPFKAMPFGFRPRTLETFNLGFRNPDPTNTANELVTLSVPYYAGDICNLSVMGSTATNTGLNEVFFNGNVRYALGAGFYMNP